MTQRSLDKPKDLSSTNTLLPLLNSSSSVLAIPVSLYSQMIGFWFSFSFLRWLLSSQKSLSLSVQLTLSALHCLIRSCPHFPSPAFHGARESLPRGWSEQPVQSLLQPPGVEALPENSCPWGLHTAWDPMSHGRGGHPHTRSTSVRGPEPSPLFTWG